MANNAARAADKIDGYGADAADAVEDMGDKAAKAGSATKRASKKGAGEIGSFFDDVQELLRRVTRLDDSDVARLRSKVEDSLESARATVQNTSRSAMNSATDVAQSAASMVRGRPWTTLGVVAIAGLVLGAILTRRD